MRRPAPLPPGLPDQFTIDAARAVGVTRGRLRRRDLTAPFRGIRSRGDIDGTLELARAYAPKLRPREHFSHVTAIALAGGWIPDRLRGSIDVAVPTPTGRARGSGVRGHREASATATRVAGLPVAEPAEAWCQAADQLTARELVVAADSLMRRHRPVLRIDQLAAAVDKRVGRRNVRILRAAIASARPGTDSVAETELRLDATLAGLPDFAVNLEIRDASGRFIALGDLVHAPTRVLLEYDGEQHRLDDRQYARDVERLDALAAAGWRVIRVNRSHRGEARRLVLDRVRDVLVSRGWTP